MPLIVAIALACAALTSAPEQANGASTPCRDGRVVKRNAHGAIREFAAEYYVCGPGHRGLARLGPSRDQGSSAHVVLIERVQLRGRHAAWVKSCYCDDFSRSDLYTFDLDTRRRKYVGPALDGDRTGVVLSLRVSRRGALAWVAGDYQPSVPAREVWVSDRDGTTRVSRGRRVSDLSVKDGMVRWIQDGRRRRHRLA